MSYQVVAALKALIAAVAVALLLWWWFAGRRSGSEGVNRVAAAALAGLGIVCFAAWWNFGRFHYGSGYVHLHEFFHYYVNAKYFPELGYTALYECAEAVEVENGHASEVARRWTRDLHSNELRRGAPVLESAATCRNRFEASRWIEFSRDVTWFRTEMDPRKWLDVFTDHGYNATPVWSIAGGLLANTGPASWRQLLLLSLLDPGLLLVMWGLVWWAFGWRVMCVALIWWGLNYPARFDFTGGAFLRQDWLLLSVAAICLAKRGRMAPAGFALAWSALLRIFPAIIALGLVIKAGVGIWRSRSLRVDPAHLRFAAGALAAVVILVPLSFTVGGRQAEGSAVWQGFTANSQKLLSTPMTNHVGLPVLVAFDPSIRSARLQAYWIDSPWDAWKDARQRMFRQRWIVYGAMVLGFLLLAGRAVDRRDDWIALVVGIGAIPVLMQLTSYYYGVLLAFAFLWPRYPAAGIGLALAALLTAVTPALAGLADDRNTLVSLFVVGLVLFVTAVSARSALPRKTRT